MAPQIQDLVGKEVGRLKVIAYDGRGPCNKPMWLCFCACGNFTTVMGQSLRRELTKSCGCLLREWYASGDKVMKAGQRYGLLTTIKRVRRDNPAPYWSCKCYCRNKVIVRASSLTSGHTRSCGCLCRALAAERAFKHGQSYTKEYIARKARERAALKRILDANWKPEMEEALRWLQPACVLCGADDCLSTDHVRPLSKGFGLEPGNAVTLCISCNSTKHDKDLDELPPDVAMKLLAEAKRFRDRWLADCG